MKKVSIVVRTFNRPSFLRKALQSLADQTVKDFEVIIVEDGPVQSAIEVTAMFPGLQITYFPIGKQVGRTKAANIGLSLTSTEWINFLDEDDLFMSHHVESMLEEAARIPHAMALYAGSIERRVRYASTDSMEDQLVNEIEWPAKPMHKQEILLFNPFPIQAVMFRRRLYEQFGGMDEDLEWLEDWDLWIRYSQAQFKDVQVVTSIFHVPGRAKERKQRRKMLEHYEYRIRQKYQGSRDQQTFGRRNMLKKAIFVIKEEGIRGVFRKIANKIH